MRPKFGLKIMCPCRLKFRCPTMLYFHVCVVLCRAICFCPSWIPLTHGTSKWSCYFYLPKVGVSAKYSGYLSASGECVAPMFLSIYRNSGPFATPPTANAICTAGCRDKSGGVCSLICLSSICHIPRTRSTRKQQVNNTNIITIQKQKQHNSEKHNDTTTTITKHKQYCFVVV